MINKNVTFKDATGEHICHNVGRKVIVGIPQYARTLKEEMIYAVREATHDSSVRPDEARLIKNPKNDTYVLETSSNIYFVRKRDSHIEIIVDAELGMGFFAGMIRDHKFSVHSEGDMTVFWMKERDGTRITHYNYFKW